MHRCQHGCYIPDSHKGDTSPGCSGCIPLKGWGLAPWGSSAWGGEQWEQVLKDAGLGMTVGERTDFLSLAGDSLELVIQYHSREPFDYTLKTKPADRRKFHARAAALVLWKSISVKDKARHIARMRSRLDPVKAAHALWDNASPETLSKCLAGLVKGRTSEAARKRWQKRTPEQKARALAILTAGRNKENHDG